MTFIVGATALFAAGLAQGCLGFGMALVATPLLLFVLAPETVVPTLFLLSTLNTLFVAYDARRHVRLGIVGPLFVGAALGFPLGVAVLKLLDAVVLKVFVGVLVTAIACLMLSGVRKPLPGEKWTLPVVGAVSGFLGASTTFSGPPVFLFLANQGVSREAFRANVVCYLLSINCYGVAVLALSRVLVLPTVGFTLALVPVMLVGTYLGIRLSRHVAEGPFRTAARVLTACAGISLAITNFRLRLA